MVSLRNLTQHNIFSILLLAFNLFEHDETSGNKYSVAITYIHVKTNIKLQINPIDMLDQL